MSFDDLLKKAQTAPRESKTVSVMVADELVEFKFTALPGETWAAIAARHPMRPDAVIDRGYGYNMHAVVKDAAAAVETETQGKKEIITQRYGARIEAGEEVPMTDAQWDGLWPVLTGSDFGNIADGIWLLNEYEPQQRVAAAKKASPRS